ncbi:HD domain-containing protein [Bacillus sp. DNRA2]|uniref:3'-5' exoribonuclease YhaM family protein n=1 Tax=Bacillus sp. DNRA2 TaxID=2723053 RepID=UPI00145F2354|nr:HD domain-containing protein [Bacillus sp. DNRA2]NMD71049.1 HD domain-containing protein [Bacillus sp. DNRA2]
MAISCLLEITPGNTFEGYCLVKEVKPEKTKKGDPYLNVTVAKKHKMVVCKLWNNGFGGRTVDELLTVFANGTILHLTGDASEYNGQTQMTINSFRVAEKEEYDLREFIEAAPETVESMEAEIRSFINEIKIPILQQITSELFEENKKYFMDHVAAVKMHHNFKSGLAYHTLSLLRIAKNICDQYGEIVNRSKMYAALTLHDMGKIVEMSRDYTAPEYTLYGQFLGHIQIVNQMIDRKLVAIRTERTVTKDEVTAVYELMNIISSHHGPLANGWGSTAEPITLEAHLCHMIDHIDAKINMISKAMVDMQEGDVQKVWGLGRIYKPKDVE